MPPSPADIRALIDATYRSESRRVFSSLVRQVRDFDLAEEALHEAFAAAVVRLVGDKGLALELARQQREYLAQHFSPSAVREQLVNVLAGVTAQVVGIRRPTRRATASV